MNNVKICISAIPVHVNDKGFHSLIVLYATNREPVVRVEFAQAPTVVVEEQGHAVRVVATVLGRTPEVRVVAIVVKEASVVPAAGGQRGKAEGVRVVTIVIPARLRLEKLTCSRLATHSIE